MKNIFENSGAVPIWLGTADAPRQDEYAEFKADFSAENDGNYELYFSSDSECLAFFDGELVFFGHYQDYPDTVIIEKTAFFAAKGSHSLRIVAWHWGINCFTHKARAPYAEFLLSLNGKTVLKSGKDTLSRPAAGYVPYKNHIITSQLGLGCEYDATMPEAEFERSREVQIAENGGALKYKMRPTDLLVCLPKSQMTVVRQGFYKITSKDTGDDAEYMRSAILLEDNKNNDAKGTYIVVDTGAEETGFIDFLLYTAEKCRVRIAWGEHIDSERGTVFAAIHSRRFTYAYTAMPGENRHTEAMRRVGGRYLQLFADSPDVEVRYLGLVPTRLRWARNDRPHIAASGLRRRIYDCAVRTLELCAHEHYEDCPWREQALYTLDSRNQMLCGYSAFKGGNVGFARASLDLIGRSVRKDKLLSLCAPAGADRPIPYYSLAYLQQLCEYGYFSHDVEFVEQRLSLCEDILSVFIERLDGNGLPRRFPDRSGYWNFYEWSDGMDGQSIHKNTPDGSLPAEAPLAAFLSLSCGWMADMLELCRKGKYGEYYRTFAEKTAMSVQKVFYSADDCLFFTFEDRPNESYSVLTQAFCLLCGAGKGIDTSVMLDTVANNGGRVNGSPIVPATLAMACYRYDALFAADGKKYAEVILGEIDRDGKYMLDRGATSFWETIKGAADFGGAGSLCHGWSAQAAYWYKKLDKEI